MQAVLVKVLLAFPYRRSRRRLYKEEKYIAVVVYEVRRPTADAHKENKNERCVGVRAVGAGGMPKSKTTAYHLSVPYERSPTDHPGLLRWRPHPRVC